MKFSERDHGRGDVSQPQWTDTKSRERGGAGTGERGGAGRRQSIAMAVGAQAPAVRGHSGVEAAAVTHN